MLNLDFALLLQFSFNSLALPLLTSFCFLTPSFFAFFRFRFVAKAVGCPFTAILMSKFLYLIKHFPSFSAVSNSSRQQWARWFFNPPADVLY